MAVSAVLCLAVLCLAAVLLDWPALDLPLEFSTNEVESMIRSWGMWGVLGSIGLMVLHSFVPFPAEIVAIANGMIYGPIWGTVITWIGAMLGAFLAFGLARAFGRPFVERLLERRHLQDLDDWAEAQGGRMVLLSRFFPVIAFNLVNYAAGLSRISWWTFAWATGIGILPLTVLMVVMGDWIDVLPPWTWVVLLIASGVLWYALRNKLHSPGRSL